MNITINPSKLQGAVNVPPSKSLLHRAIIAASLANGKSVISNISLSADIIATIDGMKALGAEINYDEQQIVINGSPVKRLKNEIDANESGSTLRFLIPIALTNSEPITFIGHNNLVKRPLDSYFALFKEKKISFTKGEEYLPLTLEGTLTPGEYAIAGDISSQFITGLLFALPLLNGDSKIIITTNLESKSYLDLTLDILNTFGIKAINHDYKEFVIPGNQTYQARNYTVEGDFSQAAFFLVADALGANITLNNMNLASLQGDKKILTDLKNFGGEILEDGNSLKTNSFSPVGTTIDFSNSPDLGPAIAVLGALASGTTEFVNAKRLRYKECDRISAMAKELKKVGIDVTEKEDGMLITGHAQIHGGIFYSHNDHRVAMALSLLSLKARCEITILNAECVSKSYPDYWSVFESLGGKIIYE